MSIAHADRYARAIVIGIIFAFLAVGASACDAIPFINDSQQDEQYLPDQYLPDPCVQTSSSGVQSVGMSSDGTLIYLSSSKPRSLPEDAAWSKNDMAVYVIRESQGPAGGEAITEARAVAIVTPWTTPDSDVIAGVKADDFGRPEDDKPAIFPESMADLQISSTGDRFVLSVTRGSTTNGLAKLYSGLVPPDDRKLEPGNGLDIVRINSFEATEGVNTYLLSPDGTKLAATISPLGELRFYDFAADQAIVYSVGAEGDMVITSELPEPALHLGVMRQPAIALPGASRMAWSPGGDTLAVANTDTVGVTGVWLVDVATGNYELVRSFRQSTVPFVQWSADGQSLFVLNTELTNRAGSSFGNSEMRRIEAREGGLDIGDAWQLSQQPWYTTAPASFTGYGDDSRFVFSWESQLWLLETPASGSGSAAYGPITDQPPGLAAEPGNLVGSIDIAPQPDTIAFLAITGGARRVGQRLYASAPSCPLAAPPAEAEGDAAAAPAEGDAQPAEAVEGEAAVDEATTGDEAGDGAAEETPAETEGDSESEGEGEGEDEGETEGEAESEATDEG